jgi:predicted transcriptional regulator of viral defense system
VLHVAEPIARIGELAKASGVLRPRDLIVHGIPRQYLRLAEQQGLIVRSGRGLYTPTDATITEFHTFAEAAKRTPRGVICLLSALRFHDIGTQSPFEVWMAIGEKDRRPVSESPRLRIFRFSKQSLDFGQTTPNVEGVPLRVFSVAKPQRSPKSGQWWSPENRPMRT